jgi:hypothetical protein
MCLASTSVPDASQPIHNASSNSAASATGTGTRIEPVTNQRSRDPVRAARTQIRRRVRRLPFAQQSIQLSVVHTVLTWWSVAGSAAAPACGAVLACAVQPRLDRADVRVNGSRDLGERQAFVFDEDDDLALQWPQRAHGLADDVADVAAREVDGLRDLGFVIERLKSVCCPPVLEAQGS